MAAKDWNVIAQRQKPRLHLCHHKETYFLTGTKNPLAQYSTADKIRQYV